MSDRFHLPRAWPQRLAEFSLGTAMQQGVNHFVEFGGGIGTAEGPADKRPNLESIVRKTVKGAGYEAGYSAGINVATLRATAAGLAG